MSSKIFQRMFFILLYALLSFFICAIGIIRPGFTPHRGEMHSMIDGTQMQPFVRRAFVPFVIRGIEFLVPISIQEKISNSIYSSMPLAAACFSSSREVFRKSCVILFLWLCMFGFCFFLHQLLTIIYHPPEIVGALFPLAALTLLPLHFFRAFMLYDIPSLFFTTACLFFCMTEKWKWYYFFFICASLNKESSVLLVLVFVFISFKKYKRSEFVFHFSSQACIWLVIFFGLIFLFRNNPGSVFDFTLIRNLFAWKINFGWIGTFQIIGYFYLLYVALRKLQTKPKVLQLMLYGLCPLYLMSLFVGYIEELRVYYESFPVIVLLIFPSVNFLKEESLSGSIVDTQ